MLTSRTPTRLTPADWTLLFHAWRGILNDEAHPLHAEARKIAETEETRFAPRALFVELTEAN